MDHYPLTAGALILALLVYVWAAYRVGRARAAFGVKVPAVHGHEGFERVFRAQQNTVEQIILFGLSMLVLITLIVTLAIRHL